MRTREILTHALHFIPFFCNLTSTISHHQVSLVVLHLYPPLRSLPSMCCCRRSLQSQPFSKIVKCIFLKLIKLRDKSASDAYCLISRSISLIPTNMSTNRSTKKFSRSFICVNISKYLEHNCN